MPNSMWPKVPSSHQCAVRRVPIAMLPRGLVNSISFALCLTLIAINCHASPSQESEEAVYSIELLYGYAYPSDQVYGGEHDDAAGSFMAAHLEDYLSSDDDHVNIMFRNTLRKAQDPYYRWFADDNLFRTSAAQDGCQVHAISLPSSTDRAIVDYAASAYIREIDRELLKQNAPEYYKILMDFEGSHLLDAKRPLYALPGYSFYGQQSAFHLATTEEGLHHLGKSFGAEIHFRSQSIPKLFHAGEVEFDHLNDALFAIAQQSSTDPAPWLAWENFEHSFAPLYSAFGLGSIGSNLTDGVSIYDADGARMPAQISMPFKQVIEILSAWYSNGVINKDFASLNYDAAIRRAKSDDHMFLSVPMTRAVVRPSRLFESFAMNDASIVLVQINHAGRLRQSLPASPYFGAEVYAACVTDKQLSLLLKVFEYTRVPRIRGDRRGWQMRVFGLEGEHYYITQNDEIQPLQNSEVVGLIPYRKHWLEHPAMWHFKRFPEITLSWIDEENVRRGDSYFRRDGKALYDWSLLDQLDGLVSGQLFQPPLLTELLLQANGWQFGTTTTLAEITQSYVWKAVQSGFSEADWNDYVQLWRSSGGDVVEQALRATE